jgi:sugar phosphate isomerase/epimerase
MKYAICNWLFRGTDFRRCCETVARHGFQGLEIAHFTLCEDPHAVSEATLREIREALQDAGLAFVGFHALLFRPADLHITSAEAAVRARARDHLRRLIDMAGALGGGTLVLGSPRQRRAEGIAPARAVECLREYLAELGPYATERKSSLLIEALPPADTNVINTLEEARSLIREINTPGVAGMFDFHNTKAERLPWAALIEEYFDIIRHVHLNAVDGGVPTTDNADFAPAFKALATRQYPGWVSLEIFHQPENPDTALGATRRFLADMEARVRV